MRAAAIPLLVVAIAALGSCSDNDAADSASGSCETATTEAEPVLGVEAGANSAAGHEVWALFFNTWLLGPGEPVRIPVDEEVKIVWRSTGEGVFAIEANGPGTETIDAVWGPDHHDSSNWDRPGDEWGTGWIFPTIGCWSFDVSHGDQAAQMVAEVFTPVESDDQ